tara:strand:+ start:1405 stop:1665 length:261 start_codon:yes stop_codon:yes gene_type:complete
MNEIKVEMILVKKDYYTLKVNSIEVGTFERSDYRQMISIIDDAITTSMVASLGDSVEPMSSDDFMKMIEQGRAAAENDEDCMSCGA